MSEREYDIDRIIETYLKYLNGPLGKGVMEHLLEGASFTVRANHELVQVSKYDGKAVVKVIDEKSTKYNEMTKELT
jgi:hypothetical protein